MLVVLGSAGEFASAWVACRRLGVATRGRVRAGAALIARGEFSIVIASLAAGAKDGADIASLAGAYVLLSAIVGPLAAKHAETVPLPARAAAPARSH